MATTYQEYFAALESEVPDLTEDLGDLVTLSDKKLWHQVTLKLHSLFENPLVNQRDYPYQIYQLFISTISTRVKLLKLSQFAVHASKYLENSEASIAFLNSEIEKIQKLRSSPDAKSEAVLLLRMHVAQHYLESGSPAEAKPLVTQGVEELQSMNDVDPSISACVYYVHSLLDKESKNFSEYYRSSLMYLSYVSSESLPLDFKIQLAVDISLAALLGEDIFSFGNLLQHPIVSVLEQTPNFAWLLELLTSFNRGDIQRYDELCVKYSALLNAQPALVQHERRLREKITIMALLDLVSSLPGDKRRVSYDDIAVRTKLDADGIEFLLMKAFALALLRGTIDEVDRFVSVTWVAPRVLTVEQVKSFKDQLDTFLTKVEAASSAVELESTGMIEV